MSYTSLINRQSGIFGSWKQVAGTYPGSPLLRRPPGGVGNFPALGADYPYETTMVAYLSASGVPGIATVNTTPNCGDVYGLQQMLQTLGFAVPITGTRSIKDDGAIASFAALRNIQHTPGTAPSGDLCRALMAEYVAVMSGGGQLPGAPAPPTSSCPPGTTGTFPLCVPSAIPGGGTSPIPGLPGGLPGGLPAPGPAPAPAPAPTTAPAAPPPPAPAPKKSGAMALWESYTTAEKALVVGGSALGAVAIGILVFGKKKPAALKATTNRP